jgi:Multiubiquitin
MSKKPKYCVNTEGTKHPWKEPTITTEQIAALGGWDVSLGVIEIDKHNNERTLAPGELVELKPGQGFCKKVKWKRGQDRIADELELLRTEYDNLAYEPGQRWVLIPSLQLPGGWSTNATSVAFQIPSAYPGTPPYGIYVPVGLRFGGARPNNYKEPAATQPPFDGRWGLLSWTPSDGRWRATADVTDGANLLFYVGGFRLRFEQGA